MSNREIDRYFIPTLGNLNVSDHVVDWMRCASWNVNGMNWPHVISDEATISPNNAPAQTKYQTLPIPSVRNYSANYNAMGLRWEEAYRFNAPPPISEPFRSVPSVIIDALRDSSHILGDHLKPVFRDR